MPTLHPHGKTVYKEYTTDGTEPAKSASIHMQNPLDVDLSPIKIRYYQQL